MASGIRRIEQIGNLEFRGKVGKNIAAYAKATQGFSRDLGRQLDHDAGQAEKAMRKLRGNPLLLHLDVYLRAKWVARHLRAARDLCSGISAESVKFHQEYRKQFITAPRSTTPRREVDL